MDTKLFALMATVGLLLFAFGPVVGTAAAANDSTGNEAGNVGLAVSVADAGNDGATVTVTDGDGEPVEGADVTVEATDGNIYIGEGEYTTDAAGTVALPEPNFDVTVDVTATNGSDSANTTVTLTTVEQSFGMSVSGYVQDLLSKSGIDGGIGFHVASFATQNNPGNAPDHAGPPEDKANAQGEQGPPEDRGNDKAKTQGPPEDRGPNKNDADEDDVEDEDIEEETEEEETEEEETEEETEEEETEEDDDEEGGDDDGESGPPDHAKGNGNGN